MPQATGNGTRASAKGIVTLHLARVLILSINGYRKEGLHDWPTKVLPDRGFRNRIKYGRTYETKAG